MVVLCIWWVEMGFSGDLGRPRLWGVVCGICGQVGLLYGACGMFVDNGFWVISKALEAWGFIERKWRGFLLFLFALSPLESYN